MPASANPYPCPLSYQLAVLFAAAATVCSLLGLGLTPVSATAVTLIATASAVEISCRLTDPHPAPSIRIKVVVLILVLVTYLVGLGYPPVLMLPTVLTGAWWITRTARRLTGIPYQLPKLVIVF